MMNQSQLLMSQIQRAAASSIRRAPPNATDASVASLSSSVLQRMEGFNQIKESIPKTQTEIEFFRTVQQSSIQNDNYSALKDAINICNESLKDIISSGNYPISVRNIVADALADIFRSYNRQKRTFEQRQLNQTVSSSKKGIKDELETTKKLIKYL